MCRSSKFSARKPGLPGSDFDPSYTVCDIEPPLPFQQLSMTPFHVQNSGLRRMEPIAGKVESSLSAESRKPSRFMNRAIEYIKSSSVSNRSQGASLEDFRR